MKFSNQTVYYYFHIVGCGKTGSAHSFPNPKCSNLSIYLSSFWIMLLFLCILTLMNGQFQRENKVWRQNSILVILHLGLRVGKDWAGPFFPPFQMFWYFYSFFSLSVYVTLRPYLNNSEWPLAKRESSFQTKKNIGTSTLLGGKRLGWPILSLLQNVLIFQSFSLLDFVSELFWLIPSRESSFQTKRFIGTSTLWGGERLGRPIFPPAKCLDLSI